MKAQSRADILEGKTNKEAYNDEKALAALTQFLLLFNGKGDKHALVKMMYWLERETILNSGYPMFFDQVFSLPYGPILSQTLDNINDSNKETSPWYGFIKLRGQREVNLLQLGNKEQLSKYDSELISSTFDRFKDMNFDDRFDFFHSLPEYRNVKSGCRDIVSLRDLMIKSGGFPEADVDEALLQIESAKLEL